MPTPETQAHVAFNCSRFWRIQQAQHSGLSTATEEPAPACFRPAAVCCASVTGTSGSDCPWPMKIGICCTPSAAGCASEVETRISFKDQDHCAKMFGGSVLCSTPCGVRWLFGAGSHPAVPSHESAKTTASRAAWHKSSQRAFAQCASPTCSGASHQVLSPTTPATGVCICDAVRSAMWPPCRAQMLRFQQSELRCSRCRFQKDIG